MDDQARRFTWPKRSVEASGPAAVAIAGNNLAPVTTNVFSGDWFPLRQAYLDPISLDSQIQPERFVGREWLFKKIDEFIANNPSGYFIIEADAGLGKTALALQLAKMGRHASHFSCLDYRARSAEAAIRNLSAQLIAAWNLTDLAPQGMLPPGSDRPSWLWQVLSAAAERRDTADSARPLVLVVDGLDEAEPHPVGTMPFGLPSRLPTGVFVVATTRTGTSLPGLRKPCQVEIIEAAEPANKWDMERFLRSKGVELEISKAINVSRTSKDAVIDKLLERCSGVWIYLHCVLSEIRLGLRDVNEVGNLPQDLEGYYAENIARIGDDESWYSWYLPLLATLGVAAEPLDCAQLAKFAGIENHERIRSFLLTRFRPFCGVTKGTDDEDSYYLYHRSLTDFVCGRSTSLQLSGNRSLEGELKQANRAAHERICEYFLSVWGSVSEHFPALQEDMSLAELEKGYAVRHLVDHLSAVGRNDDVDELVSARGQSRNCWYEAHDQAGDWDGYFRDIHLARRIAADKTATAYETGEKSPTLGAEARYSLIASSITSQMARIPVALLEALVITGTWPMNRSLDHIRRINDRATRAAAYTCVLPHLSGYQRFLTCQEALSAATAIEDPKIRVAALIGLTPLLPKQQQSVVLGEAYEAGVMRPSQYRAEMLASFCRNVDSSLIDIAFRLATQIPNAESRVRCMIPLAPRLAPSLIPEAIIEVNRLPNDEARANFLVALTQSKNIKSFTAEALAVARSLHDVSHQARALAAIAHLLDEASAAKTVAVALESARTIEEKTRRVSCLAWIAARLADGELRTEVVQEALSIVQEMTDVEERVEGVVRVSQEIGTLECRRILLGTADMVLVTNDSRLTISLSALLAPYLPRKKAKDMMRQALKLVAPISDKIERDRALAAIAAEWPAGSLSQAMTLSSLLDDESSLIRFLGALVPRLERDQLVPLVAVAESFATVSRRVRMARLLAPRVPDDLVSEVLDLLTDVRFIDRTEPDMDVLLEVELLSGVQASDEHRRQLVDELMRRRRLGDRHGSQTQDEAERDYSETIVALAPRLKQASLGKALELAQLVVDPLCRLKIHIALLPRFSGRARDAVVRNALDAAETVLQNPLDGVANEAQSNHQFMKYAELFVDLLLVVPGYARDRGVRIVASLLQKEGQEWDDEHVDRVLHRLPEDVRLQLVDLLFSDLIKPEGSAVRTHSLFSLVLTSGTYQPEVLARLLAAISDIGDVLLRIRSTLSIAPYLGSGEKKAAIDSVLRSVLEESDEARRVAAVAQVSALIDGSDRGSLLDEAVMIASTISPPAVRCQALMSLLPVFSGDRRHRIFDDVLAAARSLGEDEERCCALISLVPVADKSEIGMILEEVEGLNSGNLCADAITALSPKLSAESIVRALGIVQNISNEEDRIRAVSALCPRLTLNNLDDLANSTLGVRDNLDRVTLLRALVLAARQRSRMPGNPSLPFSEWADDLERSSLFGLIEATAWRVGELGDATGLAEVSGAILDVTLWWP